MYRDCFGYLPVRFSAEWSGGQVEPVAEFDEAREWVEANTNRDGFLYPPIVHRRYRNSEAEESGDKVPRTERQALLHRLPATHKITIPAATGESAESLRKGLAGFVMHFLGFLFGYLCQFEDWWVDRRVQMRSDTDASPHPTHASQLLQPAVKTWTGWDNEARYLATNALFFNLRAPGYEWEWERFQASYQVTDAGWRLARKTQQVTVPNLPPHGKRIEILCDQLGLYWDEDLVQKIVELRHGLFHEALWHGKQPTEAGERWLFHMDIYLRNFNVRLFLALLGLEADFIHTSWKNIGTVVLKPNEM